MKIMKKNILYTFVASLAVACSMSSCSGYLDKEPSNELTGPQVFSDWTMLRQFHWDTYNFLRNGVQRVNNSWMDSATDLAENSYGTGGTRTSFNIGNYYGAGGAPELTGTWETHYRAIRKCNMLLERIDNVPKLSTLTQEDYEKEKATFKAEDLEKGNRLDFDLTNIKEIAQDLKNWEGENNLTRIMTVIYQNLNNVLPANAVKATWTDDLGTKSVVSQYSIAATSVRPLSFAFAKDISYDRIPGYDKAEDFIDGLIDKIFAAMPDLSFLWDKFDIDRIEIDELTGDLTAKFHVYFNTRSIVSTGPKSVTISLPSYTLNGINGEKVTIHPKNPQITVTIADNDAEIIVEYNIEAELEYMARYCTEPVENIKAQIADFLEDVNDFIDSITGFTFQNVGDKFISGLNEYMQKITQNLWRFLHPNSLMQPTMLLKNTETGKYAIMSRSGKVPSKMNKTNFLIIPTTYTAELLSPAYKKFVAVTNVFKDGVSAQDGDADCKSVLDKANAQSRINEVIEGGFDEFIRFEGQNGYIYEFLYTAVDYSGKVFANKYYVKVSE